MKKPQKIFLHKIAENTATILVFVMAVVVIAMLVVIAKQHVERPSPLKTVTITGFQDPPKVLRISGDCYLSKSIPTTREEARVRDEKGWEKIVLDEKINIAGMVGRGEATWLYIPATHICGQPAGEMKTFGTWYWKRK